MNKCWYNLRISIEYALREDWSFPKPYSSDANLWINPAQNIFSETWLKSMHYRGLPISKGMIFYKPPMTIDQIAHIDLGPSGEFLHCGINWVYGGSDSQMIWYNTPDNFSVYNSKDTDANTKYASWPVTELTEIDKYTLTEEPTLVNVGVPHNIKMGVEPRWCISARIDLPLNSWEEFVEHLRSKQLI
jgi:hypothetical protein